MMDFNDLGADGMDERIESFERMLASGESFFYDNDELGLIIDYYIDFEEISKANKAIAYAESIYPFETYYKIKKAEVYMAERNVNGAIKLLEKYKRIEPDNSEIAKLLGDCYSITMQLKRAVDSYLFALNKDPQNDELLLRLARVNFALGNHSKAHNYINGFPKDYIYDELSVQEFIRLYMDYSQYTEAIFFLEKVINQDPYNYSAWYFRGLVHQRNEEYTEAIDAYEYCIAIDDDNTMGHLGKGNCLMEKSEYENAITSFQLSLDSDESDAEVYCNIAECYENMKDDNGAHFYYQKSISTNPNLSDAYFGLAMVNKRREKWNEAKRNLLKAIDIDRYESMYHIEIAELYLIDKNAQKCYEHYKYAYEIDPETTEILLDFAHAKFELDEVEEAVDLLLEHLENHDEDHRMYYRLAAYLFTLGTYEKGYNFLHAGLRIKPEEYILLYEFAPFTETVDSISNIIDLYSK